MHRPAKPAFGLDLLEKSGVAAGSFSRAALNRSASSASSKPRSRAASSASARCCSARCAWSASCAAFPPNPISARSVVSAKGVGLLKVWHHLKQCGIQVGRVDILRKIQVSKLVKHPRRAGELVGKLGSHGMPGRGPVRPIVSLSTICGGDGHRCPEGPQQLFILGPHDVLEGRMTNLC